MKRHSFAMFALAILVLNGFAGADTATDKKEKSPYSDKLPIPDHTIVCDFKLWKGSLTITKITYDKEENQIVFLLKATRDMGFTDDGFESIKFLDEDDVDMIKKKNLHFDPDVKTLKAGESTRARLDLPEDDILTRTKKCIAVASGFFKKDKN